MHLVNSTTAKNILVFFVVFSIGFTARSQENSPYSRYGLGDLTPNQNMLNRSMGGISAAYADPQTVNFINPASYGSLNYRTIFDVGFESDTKTLKSISPTDKFTATNLLISYIQLGFPVRMKNANKKGINLGMNLGLKPVSRINYKIQKNEQLPDIDTLQTIYQGKGGLSQVYVGAGLRIKKFSLGFNAGYMFGNKDYSTVLTFPNDTVYYYRSNSATKANLKGLVANAGLQYEFSLGVDSNTKTKEKIWRTLTFGVYGNLQQKLTATEDIIRETAIVSSVTGESFRVDSVYELLDNKGKVVYPSSLGAGVLFQSNHWKAGIDFETTSWQDYTYFGKKDLVKNSWKIRAGAEYLPWVAGRPSSKYSNYIRYRAGFYYGPDYINVNNTTMPEVAFTFGFGFPMQLRKTSGLDQVSILNTTFEIGSRGDNKSNVRESFVRIGVGLSLSDVWFKRSKYY